MKGLVCIIMAISLCCSLLSEATAKSYTLFRDRTSLYSIYVSSSASESEVFAAKELSYWLEECSGASFPIVRDVKEVDKYICVGYNDDVIKLDANAEVFDRSDDSFVYKNIDDIIVIYGGSERGTMYGVYTFLQREFGCRWYLHNVNISPKHSIYKFQELYHRESPGIKIRELLLGGTRDPFWAVRNKLNGYTAFGISQYPKTEGGSIIKYGSHTMGAFVPSQIYFDNHPEFFSLLEGKRQKNNTQLCLSNKDIVKICVNELIQRIEARPDVNVFALSQNDNVNYCRCDKCSEYLKKGHNMSDLMLDFVNKVADSIAVIYPDKFICMSAYQYTRKPPVSVRPRDNVIVSLCDIECCFVHTISDCSYNNEFVKDMEGWSKVAKHLYITDYVSNFNQYIAPFPNFKVLQSNIKLFQKYGAEYIYEMGAYNTNYSDFDALRASLISAILWNPDVNIDQLVDEFFRDYFGEAGAVIRQYYDFINDAVGKFHMTAFAKYTHPYFTDGLINGSIKLFDKAKAMSKDKIILRRIEIAELPILYIKIRKHPKESNRDGTTKHFKEVLMREGFDCLQETDNNYELLNTL